MSIRTQYAPGSPGSSVIAWKVDTFADLSLLKPTAADEGRIAQALDTRALYVLLNYSPVSWLSLGTGSVTPPGPSSSPDSVWTPLSVMAVENPMNHGATGNGTTDDLTALQNTVNALPAIGGLVYFPSGKSFKKSNVWAITKNGVKLWSVNRGAEIFGSTAGNTANRQAIHFTGNGIGVFGLKLRSDATVRQGTLLDHFVSSDGCTTVEECGVEVQGSAATGLFHFACNDIYVERCYVHDTMADHIHHTEASYNGWAWNNYIHNASALNRGDDGIAAITYGHASARNHDFEWWNNVAIDFPTRAYSCVGADNMHIHHNWGIHGGAACVLVASEPGYDSAADDSINAHHNYGYQCGQTIGHPTFLVSSQNSAAGPISNVAFDQCVSNGDTNGDYGTNGYGGGALVNVTSTNLHTNFADFPVPMPTTADAAAGDTSQLRTRNIAPFIPAGQQPGLHRIHVRPVGSPSAPSGFEQRFEYVVQGTPANVTAWVATRTAAGDYLAEQQTVSGTAYALLLTSAPVALGAGVSAVTFAALRAGDNAGTLSWLWARIDQGDYA